MPATIADIMTHPVLTVSPETPLNEAVRLLAENHISGLPVVDADNKLVGVISESDLMWRETGVHSPAYIMLLDSVIYLENPAKYDRDLHKALGQTVAEVMTKHKNLTTIPTNCPIASAANLLLKQDIRRLPVLDEAENLVGIVTRGDIIQLMAAEQNSSTSE